MTFQEFAELAHKKEQEEPVKDYWEIEKKYWRMVELH